jgi:hypothetical protein
MHRIIGIIIALSLSLGFSHPSTAGSQPTDSSKENALLAQDRLVVFEGFLRST